MAASEGWHINNSGQPYLTETFENTLDIIVIRAGGQFQLKWFYEMQLPAMLKKLKTDAVIHLDGCLSVRAKQPQLLAVDYDPETEKGSHNPSLPQAYSRKKLSSFTSHAAAVISFSEKVANELRQLQPAANVTTICPAAEDRFLSLEWEQKEEVRVRFTDGNEFFLVCADFTSQEMVLNLLKAFSIFKKWQQSNMKLALTGRLLFDQKNWPEKFGAYKFRDEVKLIPEASLEELAELTASAYAFIHLGQEESDTQPLLRAMRAATGIITIEKSSYKETCGDAALYISSTEPLQLGENLVRIYKNEQMRNLLIRNGLQRTESFNYQQIQQQLRNLIIAAI